jgi:ABC-type transport system substrate-binding protein
MTGIIRSNPFHVLQIEELSDMARKIGIHVDTEVIDVSVESDRLGSDNIQMGSSDGNPDPTLEVDMLSEDVCPRTPDQYNTDQEFDDRGENVWVHVTRKKRGKHPRKSFR